MIPWATFLARSVPTGFSKNQRASHNPYARSAQMPCLVDFYDCLRAWANPKSVGYPPWKKGKLDCHEYYYEEFLTKPMAVQQKGGH